MAAAFVGAARPFVAAAALALPMVIYLRTMAPTITWAHDGADGGDLITAAYTLGVPHPPGYPVYCLLGWLFAHLPVRDVAWRLSFMSALGAGVAALGLYAAVVEWQGAKQAPGETAVRMYSSTLAGLGAAWGLAFVPLLWSQAIIAEVYAVNAAFVACVLWLAIRVWRGTAPPLVLGLAWGLSLGTHLTSLALLPVVVVSLTAGQHRRPLRPAFLHWLSGLALGLSTYAYLPLRAGRGAVTWGDPTTLAGWWWVVSGALYRSYVFALPPEALANRLFTLARYLVYGFGPTGMVLGVAGAQVLARRHRVWLLASATCWILYVAYAIGYDTTDSYTYLVPAFIVFAFWLGEGLAGSLDWLHRHLALPWRQIAGLCLACAGPLFALTLNYRAMDVHQDRRAHDFGAMVLATAPQRAVLLSTQDAHTFTLWYFQRVLGQRPDLTVVDSDLWAYDWYRTDVRDARIDPTRPACRVVEEEGFWLKCTESE